MTKGSILEIPSFTFHWSIPDLLLLLVSSEKSGTRYFSPDFQCGDTTWCLSIYPNGVDSEDYGWISLYLMKRKSNYSKDVVTYTLGVKYEDGVDYIRREVVTQEFGENGIGRGCHRFLERKEFFKEIWQERKNLAPGIVLTVYCSLSFQRGVSEEAQQTNEKKSNDGGKKTEKEHPQPNDVEQDGKETISISKGVEKMSKDFKELLLDERDCDVTLKVKGRDFRTHMLILRARSPVFCSMFKHDTVEKNIGTVDITDCDPDAFQDFLLYLYSGKVVILSICSALNVYSIADKYGVDDLKLECVHFIEENLSVDTFGDVMALALRFKDSSLIETATDFFTKNIRKILVTVKWKSFVTENPIAANELHIKALNSIIP